MATPFVNLPAEGWIAARVFAPSVPLRRRTRGALRARRLPTGAALIATKLTELLRAQEPALAEEILCDDDRVDDLHATVFDVLLGEAWPGRAADTVDATLASRYHERFADHAVSIAKKVRYLGTGDWTAAEQV